MGEEDGVELRQADRPQQLLLRPLAAVEQHPVAAGAQQHRGQAPAGGGHRAGRAGEEEREVHRPSACQPVEHDLDDLDPVAMARERFGLAVSATSLPGEHDRNFLVQEPGGARHLLKVRRRAGGEDAGGGAPWLQDAALAHLEAAAPAVAVPRVEATHDGVRLYTWVPGEPWAGRGPHGPEALRSLGRAVAAVDRALAGFDHPDLARPHPWNLLGAASARAHVAGIPDAELAALAMDVLDRFARELRPRLDELPHQAIHNDANDHNVLVGDAGLVTGLVDFGDVCRAPKVCGLAVACAYAMLGLERPVAQSVPLVAGYHELAPLAPRELELLFDLAATRLALSAAMAARQSREQPANEYLLVSQQGVGATLRRLREESRELAHLRLRDACGYEPVPGARRVRAWLASEAAGAGPVVTAPLAGAPVLDWTPGSAGTGTPPAELPALGRYLEERAIYTAEAFATEDPAERRTVHLGVDVFLPAGTPVLAPLDGVVHDVALAPRSRSTTAAWSCSSTAPATACRSSRSTATSSRWRSPPGDPVARGEEIGRLGTEAENGGWAPHLHLQLLTTDARRGMRDRRRLRALASATSGSRSARTRTSCSACRSGVRAEPRRDPAGMARARRASLSSALSLSYAEPLADRARATARTSTTPRAASTSTWSTTSATSATPTRAWCARPPRRWPR